MIVNVWNWLNDQLLKMRWLEELVHWLMHDVIGLETESALFHSLAYFVYDTIKIFLLLSTLIFIASYLTSALTPERTQAILGKIKGIPANILGALLGTVTPFCSCSSIPIFIGFTKAGIPVGVTFSFLISSPLVDLASVILLASIFNWKIALAYVGVGLIMAVVGGIMITVFKMERYVEGFVYANPTTLTVTEESSLSRKERFQFALRQVKDIIHRVWLFIFIGVGIGALIHGYIPEAWITSILGSQNLFSVPLAVLVGVPMYADIFGTLPIAQALVAKGVGIGTVLSFMMAVTALSFPSMVMLSKVIKPKLLMFFIGFITFSIILIGYLFNLFGWFFI